MQISVYSFKELIVWFRNTTCNVLLIIMYGGFKENGPDRLTYFECFDPSRWNYLRSILRCGLVGAGVSISGKLCSFKSPHNYQLVFSVLYL